MTFSQNHPTEDQLLELVRGEMQNAGLEYHLAQCWSCRRALGRSMLLGGLLAAPQEQPGSHLTAGQLDRFHAGAFEAGPVGGRQFLAQCRHVWTCSSCFSRFFALHQELNPSTSVKQRVLADFRKSGPPEKLGLLHLMRGASTPMLELIARPQWPDLSPQLDGVARSARLPAKEDLEDFDLRSQVPPLGAPGSKEAEPPPSESASWRETTLEGRHLRVESVSLSFDVTWDGDRPTLAIRRSGWTDAGRPPILIEVIARPDIVEAVELGSRETVRLPIPSEAGALRISKGPLEGRYELSLEVRRPRNPGTE